MRRLVQAFTIAAAAALAACSGGDDGPFAPPPPGCDHQPTNAICVTSPTLTEPACGWTWRPEGCPGTNLVGTCAEPSGQVTYFYSPGYNVFSADAACFGAFTPIASGPIVSVWCDLRAVVGVELCADATGPSGDVAFLQTVCAAYGGSWHTTGACPTAGRTGTCSTQDLTVSYALRYYNPGTASSDAASCTANGDTWTPN